jgi:signal transduction histidine kinase
MRTTLLISLFLFCNLHAFGEGTKHPTITNISGIAGLSDAQFACGRDFDITGTVVNFRRCFPKDGVCEPHYSITLHDGEHALLVHGPLPPETKPGSVIRAVGKTMLRDGIFRDNRAERTFSVPNAAHAALRTVDVTMADLANGGYEGRFIRIEGTVKEVFTDEVDPAYVYIVLNVGGSELNAAAPRDDFKTVAPVGATVKITGVYSRLLVSVRRFMGPLLRIVDPDSIVITKPMSSDLSSLPECPSPVHAAPKEIESWGRRKITGTVLAVRDDDNRLILKSGDGQFHLVKLVRGYAAPAVGARITAGGKTCTDLYHINLAQALWIPSPGPTETPSAESEPEVNAFLQNEHGGIAINLFGRAVKAQGKVIQTSGPVRGQTRLYIDCDGTTVAIDVKATGKTAVDFPLHSRIEVDGICFMEIGNWSTADPFPHISEIALVTRSPGDIRIIAMPPWWTTGRLAAVIAVLAFGIAAVLAWNRSLSFLVDRRSRELLREQISHAGTVMKVDERTRLAVELHDSLSQNLAGVGCQIESMRCALSKDPSSMPERLAIAKRMLMSCRTELKRCLFDLRCEALEEGDLSKAVRTVLEPVIDDCELAIRFNVPRRRLLDTTAHSIICIIRELASNAVRHGHASKILIAGDLTDGRLQFSVRDNGRGFSTESAPGPAEGHFGLQGVKDRVDRMGGTLRIESGKNGTYAKITVHLAKCQPKA